MQCTNKIKQLSLGLHNYHDVKAGFPAGSHYWWFKTEDGGTSQVRNDYYFSGLIQLFPFIELNARYDGIASLVLKSDELDHASAKAPCPWQGGGNAAWTRANYPIHGNIDALLCPSDTKADVAGATSNARTTYSMSRGDAITRDATSNKRGMFGYFNWQNMSSVTDGTSNTIAFSEAIAYNATKGVVKGWLVVADGANLKTTPLTTCGSIVLNTKDRKLYTGTATDQPRCSRFADTRCYMGFFNTVNQPNSPSCANTNTDGTATYGVWSASSNHSGGVNCGLVDGSVRFISDTVNNTTSGLSAAPQEVATGNSEFGVWGAYGTVDGGESTAL
ncbi:MAG: DUF1559 domain-containing protein [Planctomycetaceae bacterium]|nr:DUF1559 domain-containing protein [Planctomycetaceae bacterium]